MKAHVGPIQLGPIQALWIAFAIATFAAAAARLPHERSFDQRSFEAFMDDASRFERTLNACPIDAWRIDQCAPLQGRFDAKLWRKVQNEGFDVFGKR